jgi:hypothetical protein
MTTKHPGRQDATGVEEVQNNHGSDKQVDAPEDGVRKSTETRRAR